MNVLINAASANMGGAVTYLKNILRWLPVAAPEDHFTVYLPEATKPKLTGIEETSRLKLITYPHDNTGGAARMYFDQVGMLKLLKKHNANLLFSSTGFGTYWSSCPQVLLVRNPVYFSTDFHKRYEELGRSLRRNTQRRWMSLFSIRSSDMVLFPTKAMQDMVAPYINLDRKETRAIHYGFDHQAFSQNGSGRPEFLQQINEWKAQGYKILLNVSTYAVHKNFETLIESLAHLKARDAKVKLLTTTSREKTADKVEYDAMVERARALGVKDMWHELSYVPYDQLKLLYESSDVYVFPSFTESFGHSLVEAMASGLPVIAADMPVNCEVCDVAGRYFPTHDEKACADEILKVLESPELHKKLTDASLERAKHFSWKGYVEQLVQVFRQAV